MTPELDELRERLAEITHLHGALAVLSWDQGTYMPPAGARTRGDQAGTLERLAHEALIHPEMGRLLDRLEEWAAGQDPDSDDARLVACARRDHRKATCVPPELTAAIAREAAVAQQAWDEARAASDFARLRDPLARLIDLRRRYAACFADAEHPYDALLDDFEPGLTTAELRPLFDAMSDRLSALVRRARIGGEVAFPGTFPVEDQRRAVLSVLHGLGFDPRSWRLDQSPHPFCQSGGPGDYRITTRYQEDDLVVGLYSCLHEFGHGLYEAGLDPRHYGTPLGAPVSLGIHESQSRLWENVIGRSRPFAAWLLERLREELPGGLRDTDEETVFRGLNGVEPSFIRVDADETTYNLHIALRFDLEVALLEGKLDVDGLPAAWNEGTARLLGLDVGDDADGVLQDIHWSLGSFGYFPTYTIGNLMAAQLDNAIRRDIGDLDDRVRVGDFAPLREWLRDRVHRHGRKFGPRELLERATGEKLSHEPYLEYLEAKLVESGALGSAPPDPVPASG